MEQKLIFIALAALLYAGVSQALKCYTCTYKMTNGTAASDNTDGCQGGDDFNATALTSANCANKCFAKYMKTDDSNYEWERGCSASATCEEKNGGADDWMTCCDKDNCNVHVEYPTSNDMLSQCYECTYTEVNGTAKTGSTAENCKDDVSSDNTIAKIACNTNCFVEKKTNGDEITWSRGCKASCTTAMKDDDYLNCCSMTNLCNAMEGKDKETSGSDVIFRPGNLMSAIAVVVMTMAARYLV